MIEQSWKRILKGGGDETETWAQTDQFHARDTHLPSCLLCLLLLLLFLGPLKGFQVPQSEPFSIRAHVLGAALTRTGEERKKGVIHIRHPHSRGGGQLKSGE